jgi:hypothetical protein
MVRVKVRGIFVYPFGFAMLVHALVTISQHNDTIGLAGPESVSRMKALHGLRISTLAVQLGALSELINIGLSG